MCVCVCVCVCVALALYQNEGARNQSFIAKGLASEACIRPSSSFCSSSFPLILASGVMSQNIGGTIFARERSDRAGGGCGRGM